MVKTYTAIKTTTLETYNEAKETYNEAKTTVVNATVKTYNVAKTTVVTAYEYQKEKINNGAKMVKSQVETIGVNLQKTSGALKIAPDAKTKAQVVFGPLNALLSGDLFDEQRGYSFVGQKYAVIEINGMDNSLDDAKDMRAALHRIFDVTDSAMISNEKGFLPFGLSFLNDGIQTVGYETLGFVDTPAINVALAIKAGIRQKGTVCVLAHSQGSEIFNQALKLLTPKERMNIYYQGFGPETYIDAKSLGLAGARNVINKGDLIPKAGNVGKITSSFVEGNSAPITTTNYIRTIVTVKGQVWEVVDSPANTMGFEQATNPYIKSEDYSKTNNHHGFLKYYSYFVDVPRRDK